MRDGLILILVFGSLPIILSRPWIGILVWSWLGYMSPHRLTWSFAYSMPFAAIVGATTLLALFFYKGRKTIPIMPLTVVWLAWIAWMNLSTVAALDQPMSMIEWDRTMKIQLFALLTVVLIRSRYQTDMLVFVIVGSLGFFGVKGGLFSILTGGENLVWGPPGSFIEDNNALGLALVMTMPLMVYAFTAVEDKRAKLAFIGVIALTLFAILGTHSRGAALALASMGAVLWFFSSRKIAIGIVMILAAVVAWNFMPESFHDRIASIKDYKTDGSAMGRINAWWFAYYFALDNPMTGGGFNTFTPELFLRYAPFPDDFHDAHSIYFEVLAEHGFIGLGLFLSVAFIAIITNIRTIFMVRNEPKLHWMHLLARALVVSICAYLVGGAFLGLAYFDLYYHLISLTVIMRVVIAEEIRERDLTRVSEQLKDLEARRRIDKDVSAAAAKTVTQT